MNALMRPYGVAAAASALLAVMRVWSVGLSTVRRRWLDPDKSRRALAAVDDNQISDLSEIGRRIRREERRTRH